MEHKIPAANWLEALARAVLHAEPGDTIIVQTEIRKQLAVAGINRLDKPGVKVLVSGELSEA